jgi:hypothetical protein
MSGQTPSGLLPFGDLMRRRRHPTPRYQAVAS